MIFTNITGLVVGLLAIAAGIVLLLRARNSVSTIMLALIAVGLLTLSMAMGEPTLRWPVKQTVTVMVDLSPSTRGAAYRDPKWLDARIKAPLADVPYKITNFEGDSSRETHFAPAPDHAVLLFSDAQFGLPNTAPPTYVAVDPNLEQIDDAAVVSLHLTNDHAVAEVMNHGPLRAVAINGITATVPTGASIQWATVKPGELVTARVESEDRWPENDSLSIRVPPPPPAERWWIGQSPADASWRSFTPAQLPADASAYLNAGIIVLSDVSADALSLDQQRRLWQYVRDLGGTLLILGGENAFASGRYVQATLDDLSPLASTPPSPTTHWILLVDSSGSMATPIGSTTRFRGASEAAAMLLSHLPPSDLVSVGGFARDLSWWVNREPVIKVDSPIPPPNEVPNGPTNLESALQAIAQSADRSLSNELLIISDTDAAISDPSTLAKALHDARVTVSVLSIGDAALNNALAQISTSTGGRFVQQRDAAQWPATMQDLARSASPDYLLRGRIDVTFTGALDFLGKREVALLNRTWLKNGVTIAGTAQFNNETIPVAGNWQFGGGRVISIATECSSNDAKTLADRFCQRPTDPRFKVMWDDGSQVKVRIDAVESGQFLNGLSPALRLMNPSTGTIESHPISQIGPGEYELALPAPSESMLATVVISDRVVARTALAGHYPREFYPLGNDHIAMQKLARMTGGDVIEPNDNRPIDFHWPTRTVSLAPWLATIGALALAGALICWRRG